MKRLLLSILFVLVASSPAWCVGPGGCTDVSVPASPTSTQVFTAGTDLFKYVMVQNKGACSVYIAFGSNNAASATNGIILAPNSSGLGGGAWMPGVPAPALDMAASGNGCTTEVYACEW